MLMMLAALGKIGRRLWSKRQAADAHGAGGFGENWWRLWSKRQAADAHDAGGVGENWGDCGVNARQLMLMMLAALGKIGASVEESFGENCGDCGGNARQLMLMMLADFGKIGVDCGVRTINPKPVVSPYYRPQIL